MCRPLRRPLTDLYVLSFTAIIAFTPNCSDDVAGTVLKKKWFVKPVTVYVATVDKYIIVKSYCLPLTFFAHAYCLLHLFTLFSLYWFLLLMPYFVFFVLVAYKKMPHHGKYI
jgi:cytochrome c biogenesis protein ResB